METMKAKDKFSEKRWMVDLSEEEEYQMSILI